MSGLRSQRAGAGPDDELGRELLHDVVVGAGLDRVLNRQPAAELRRLHQGGHLPHVPSALLPSPRDPHPSVDAFEKRLADQNGLRRAPGRGCVTFFGSGVSPKWHHEVATTGAPPGSTMPVPVEVGSRGSSAS